MHGSAVDQPINRGVPAVASIRTRQPSKRYMSLAAGDLLNARAGKAGRTINISRVVPWIGPVDVSLVGALLCFPPAVETPAQVPTRKFSPSGAPGGRGISCTRWVRRCGWGGQIEVTVYSLMMPFGGETLWVVRESRTPPAPP